MSEFCEKCCKQVLRLDKKQAKEKGWLVKKGYVCEGCGYDYMKVK